MGLHKCPLHPSAFRFHQNPMSKFVQKCHKHLKTHTHSALLSLECFYFSSPGSNRRWEGNGNSGWQGP